MQRKDTKFEKFQPHKEFWQTGVLNWTEVLQEYEKVWSLGPEGAYIRVDKSPPNIAKIPEIAEHFARDKSQVAFIVMTRSPCTISRTPWEKRKEFMRMLTDGLKVLHKGYRFLELKYEDLLMNPCGTAKKVLEFLPELELLNPGRAGYREPNNVKISTARGASILDYALDAAHHKKVISTQNHSIGEDAYKLSQLLGYQDLQRVC